MTTAEVNVSRPRAWVMAARPQTLPAAIAPVLVGTAIALHEHVFALYPALFAAIGAALIQIGTNFANDYYDAKHGADTDDRDGFTRVTQSGLIPAHRVKVATIATFALAILTGTYLVYVGGLPIVVIGLLSVFCGWAYTGGPYPLGYHGLGEVFVFVFFGLVAVAGTFYVQAAATLADPLTLSIPSGTIVVEALVAGVPMATLASAILVVNNLRDIETDAAVGKRTLAVRFGERFSRYEYAALLAVAYLVPFWFYAQPTFTTFVLAPLLTIPHAALLTRYLWTHDGSDLNWALERTGILLTLYAICFAGGLILA
ncbi:1,4-dihydroxy-2-naphthoate polyprenyltransferase [Halovivax gelatinilyticus]|uniref:1,4-dihydroxy-2-naphthoate polyprenyltransferase n=1 Tax=Halovivax gelatinilyticus TaxID=2961597 RepID=UPI0020CA6400|nr:1,4-dihydroxy-2-naphthoate polyprenyltransferase [Halovivax gelatinilyticus]